MYLENYRSISLAHLIHDIDQKSFSDDSPSVVRTCVRTYVFQIHIHTDTLTCIEPFDTISSEINARGFVYVCGKTIEQRSIFMSEHDSCQTIFSLYNSAVFFFTQET